jgi:hypothetical protein
MRDLRVGKLGYQVAPEVRMVDIAFDKTGTINLGFAGDIEGRIEDELQRSASSGACSFGRMLRLLDEAKISGKMLATPAVSHVLSKRPGDRGYSNQLLCGQLLKRGSHHPIVIGIICS